MGVGPVGGEEATQFPYLPFQHDHPLLRRLRTNHESLYGIPLGTTLKHHCAASLSSILSSTTLQHDTRMRRASSQPRVRLRLHLRLGTLNQTACVWVCARARTPRACVYFVCAGVRVNASVCRCGCVRHASVCRAACCGVCGHACVCVRTCVVQRACTGARTTPHALIQHTHTHGHTQRTCRRRAAERRVAHKAQVYDAASYTHTQHRHRQWHRRRQWHLGFAVEAKRTRDTTSQRRIDQGQRPETRQLPQRQSNEGGPKQQAQTEEEAAAKEAPSSSPSERGPKQRPR